MRGAPVYGEARARTPSSLPVLGLWCFPWGSAPPVGPLHVAVGTPLPSTSCRGGRGGKPIPESVERSLGPSSPQCRGSVCPGRALGLLGLVPPCSKEPRGFSFGQLCHLLMFLGARPWGCRCELQLAVFCQVFNTLRGLQNAKPPPELALHEQLLFVLSPGSPHLGS